MNMILNNCSDLSWEDESINNVIVGSSNGTSSNNEESKSDTPKHRRHMSKNSNDCYIQTKEIACDVSTLSGVIGNGALVKITPLFGSVISKVNDDIVKILGGGSFSLKNFSSISE